MSDDGDLWFRFGLAVLATWRVTHLLASEDGPADVIVRVRARLGSGILARLMDCFQCLSFWVAVPLSLFVVRWLVDRVVAWLALAGAACLLEAVTKERAPESPLNRSFQGESDHGVLWTEASGPERHDGDRSRISAGQAPDK